MSEFPEGETRLATFRNPNVMPTDGKTVDTACWVRHVQGDEFQVFAVNCAHLGCPVRWFPQSGLFMCPCHGGASSATVRALRVHRNATYSNIPTKWQDGLITIQAGELPTPGRERSLRFPKTNHHAEQGMIWFPSRAASYPHRAERMLC